MSGDVTIKFDAGKVVGGLEEKCWQCRGAGLHPLNQRSKGWISPDSAPDAPTCGICEGKGYHLTDAGNAMLAFLKRWL